MINKKVCIFTSAHLEYDVRIFKKEIITLLNNGYTVYYLTNKENLNSNKEFIKNQEFFNHQNLSVTYNSSFNEEHRIKRFIKSLFFFLNLPRDCSVYHFHDPDLLFTGLVLKVLGKRVIYDVHENYRDTILEKKYLPKYSRKLLSIIISFFETFCGTFFDKIICATPYIEQSFLNANIKRTLVINNYPFKAEFMPLEIDTAIKENIIIYAGGITQPRGVSSLIDSIYLVNQSVPCKLKLAGEISPLKFEKELRALKGWKHVEYLGLIKRSELAKELNKAKVGAVLFLPEKNHINAQPNKLFEYMSASIAVIASNFPLWIDIVAKNKCGICVNPQSPEEIAKAVIQIISDDKLSKKMGENGRELIEEKYNWENEEIKLINTYSTLFS